MSLPPLMVSTAPFLGPCLPLPSFASPGQNATESLKQVRSALERWHKAASVTGATWQSAGVGTGTRRLVSTCGSRAGTWGFQREEHRLLGLRHKMETQEVEIALTP